VGEVPLPNLRKFSFFNSELKTTIKRQSDGESNDDDEEEQTNGYTDENQQWLKPKKKKVLSLF